MKLKKNFSLVKTKLLIKKNNTKQQQLKGDIKNNGQKKMKEPKKRQQGK